ncbi:hypothetical protein ACLIYM_25355 [Streptomyces fenghuangensis]
MTDHTAPSAPEEPVGGPQSTEQPAPGPRATPPRADASDGRTASPAERAALTELIRLTEDMGLYEDRQPTSPDVARYARWLAVVRGDRGLDPAIAHAITAAAIREADDEHTGIQLACAEQAARAEAHLEGVSAEADGWQRKYEQAERRLAQLRARSDRHVYLSTGCLHGQHGYCQGKNGLAGAKTPASCKFCAAPCVCDCHHGDETAAPVEGSDQRRTHDAQEPAVPAAGLRGLLEHVGIDTTGRDITVDGKVVDAAPAGGSDQRRQQYAHAEQRLHLIDGMRQANLDAAAAAIQRAERAEAALDRVRARLDTWEQRLPDTIRTATVIEALRNDLDRSQP